MPSWSSSSLAPGRCASSRSGVFKLLDLDNLASRVVPALSAHPVGHLRGVTLRARRLAGRGELPCRPAAAGGGSRLLSLGQGHLRAPLQPIEGALERGPAQVRGLRGVPAVGGVAVRAAGGAQPAAGLLVQGPGGDRQHDHVAQHGLEVDAVRLHLISIAVLGAPVVVHLVDTLLEAAIVAHQAPGATQVHGARHLAGHRDAIGHAVRGKVQAHRLVLADPAEGSPETGDGDFPLDAQPRTGTGHQLRYVNDQPRHVDHNLQTIIAGPKIFQMFDTRPAAPITGTGNYLRRARTCGAPGFVLVRSSMAPGSRGADSRRPWSDTRPRATAASVFWSTISKLASLAST